MYNYNLKLIKQSKPCPLCGTPIEIVNSFSDTIIRCPNCQLKSKYFPLGTDIDIMVRYWNDRKPSKELIASVEELRQQNDKLTKEIRDSVEQIKELKEEKFRLEKQIERWKYFSECDRPSQLRSRLCLIKHKVELLKKKISME